ncbi:hypothetical protein [Nonomuraea sp. LPB2021202275-12-8]|uniref:hypothetical protein n=1 Tax=Nonomuraea sp. LPB2021202275-12-8 TaxID=3120159 RepID=UPI00300D5B5C
MRIVTTLAMVIAALLVAPAAQAEPHHDSVRYASVKGCENKDGAHVPCGHWRLVMHSGEQRLLRDAQVVARQANGKSAVFLPAPVSVSGDGQKVAYFTKSGRLAVRSLHGDVTLLPSNTLPRVAQAEVALQLSGDGARLAVATGDDRYGTRVFDTAGGARLGVIPGPRSLAGFSGDGGELLMIEDSGEAVTLAVHADTGERLTRVTPPQTVSANPPPALSGDGRTVAVFIAGKSQIVLYDAETDEVLKRVTVKLPAGELHLIDWIGEQQVTVHLTRQRAAETRMTIAQIDTETGDVTIRDRYTVLKDTFVFATCGG